MSNNELLSYLSLALLAGMIVATTIVNKTKEIEFVNACQERGYYNSEQIRLKCEVENPEKPIGETK